jgi:hypothetical protein
MTKSVHNHIHNDRHKIGLKMCVLTDLTNVQIS